jgi:AcrR family transcriptional regulator
MHYHIRNETYRFIISEGDLMELGDTSPNDSRTPQSPARGRPLSQRTDQAILDAANDLLAERGLSEIAIEEIAARARVSKASIYRRWPSKGTLAFDAFVTRFLGTQPIPDTGRLDDDLRAALRNWVRTVDGTTAGRTLRGLIAEVQRDPDLAIAWRERFIDPVRAGHLIMTERAIARGELSPDADANLLLDLLFGPAYHRLLQGHLPLDDAFISGVGDAIIAAVTADGI